MWLDNGLRQKLDERAVREGRSLAATIDVYLRKGLGLKMGAASATPEEKADAPVFG